MKRMMYALLVMAIIAIGIPCSGYAMDTAQGTSVPATTCPTVNTSAPSADYSQAAFDLKMDMRELWTEHVVWTRMYIIASLADAPDKDAAAARLLANQEDIGDAIRPMYGDAAGDALTARLKDHILIAVDIIDDVKAGNTTRQEIDEARWTENADNISAFLARANPSWPEATLKELMHMHLLTTRDELVARHTGNYTADVDAYDRVYDHILVMSDTLSDGIVQQCPEKFGK